MDSNEFQEWFKGETNRIDNEGRVRIIESLQNEAFERKKTVAVKSKDGNKYLLIADKDGIIRTCGIDEVVIGKNATAAEIIRAIETKNDLKMALKTISSAKKGDLFLEIV